MRVSNYVLFEDNFVQHSIQFAHQIESTWASSSSRRLSRELTAPGRKCAIALDEGHPVAYLAYDPLIDKDGLTSRCHIPRIVVEKPSRRLGIGTEFIDELCRILISDGSLPLLSTYTDERHLEAQLFFRSLGFRWVRTENRGDASVYRFETHVNEHGRITGSRRRA